MIALMCGLFMVSIITFHGCGFRNNPVRPLDLS
jgi:hypothetical protein